MEVQLMFKKSLLAFTTAILFATLFVGFASADEGIGPQTKEKRAVRSLIGQVVEIGDREFTIETRKGEVTLMVTEETVFKNREGDALSFSDLELRQYVTGRFGKDDEGNLIARVVIILPDDFDPQQVDIVRLQGKVEKINFGQGTFDLLTQSGDLLTIHVNERTKFMGSVENLKDLEKGMRVTVAAIRGEEGNILAKVVVAGRQAGRPKIGKAIGEVTLINDTEMSIVNRDGKPITFIINEQTKFVSEDGSLTQASDIENGQKLLVVFVHTDDGSNIAKAIGGGKGPE
jgi:hypothetical protein